MPAGYEALPNPRSHLEEDELEAAFEASDDEDEGDEHNSESRPLDPVHAGSEHDDDRHSDQANPPATGNITPSVNRTQNISAPGTYNFEAVDYDYPPPGSPPPNSWGNSNGVIPSSPVLRPSPSGQGRSWVRRVLPARMADRLIRSGRRQPVLGRGVDGVFANVTAKPSVPRQITEEDGVYVLPEDSQKEAPPSYAAAQADAVPPYWETTVHAPSSLSPGMMVPGELPIEGLATGTVFSFLWNMLVSISFQFVGFLLTYLLHTTHAAKLGARAGLGLTLVQYGFAIKSNRDELGNVDVTWGTSTPQNTPEPRPSFESAAEADAWYVNHPNTTMDGMMGGMMDGSSNGGSDMMGDSPFFASDSTSEWLAFLLMTIGWFILLNSLLGFWRIKRWEREILASHQENPERTPQISTSQGHSRQSSFARHFERTLGLRLPNFSLGAPGRGQTLLFEYDENLNRIGQQDLERGSIDEEGDRRTIEEEIMAAIPPDHPDRERLVTEAIANERRLQHDLRAAGLL